MHIPIQIYMLCIYFTVFIQPIAFCSAQQGCINMCASLNCIAGALSCFMWVATVVERHSLKLIKELPNELFAIWWKMKQRQLVHTLICHIISIPITEQFKTLNLMPINLFFILFTQKQKKKKKDKLSYTLAIYWLSHASHACSGMISRFLHLQDEYVRNVNAFPSGSEMSVSGCCSVHLCKNTLP